MTAIKTEPKKHAITFSGDIGSGKTTVAKFVEKWTDFELMVVGNLFRDEAAVRGISFDEFQTLMKKDKSIDLAIDIRQKEFIDSRSEFLADSRLSAYFAPNAFNVYFIVDPLIGAERNFKALAKDPQRLVESNIKSVQEMMESNFQRRESEKARYAKLYSFDYTDLRRYDLVISTNHLKPKEVAEAVFKVFKQWRSNVQFA